MDGRLILTKPIITEKSLKDASNGVFTFEVNKYANKIEIKKAIEEMFKVHVKRVTTTLRKGKERRVGNKRLIVKNPDSKRARVKLLAGEKIDLFEVGQTK